MYNLCKFYYQTYILVVKNMVHLLFFVAVDAFS